MCIPKDGWSAVIIVTTSLPCPNNSHLCHTVCYFAQALYIYSTENDSQVFFVCCHRLASLSEGTQLDDLNKCRTYSLMNATVQSRILLLHLRVNLHISW